MPWFKVDDHLHSNKKVLRIPRNRRCGAMGLWLLVGTWCTSNLTDGQVPDYIVAELGGTPGHVRDLVACGLWIALPDAEHQFPNWSEYQPTREKVEEVRESERERKARQREERRAAAQQRALSEKGVPPGVPPLSHRDTAGTHPGVPPVSQPGPTYPDPTRPDPTRPERTAASLDRVTRGHLSPVEPPSDDSPPSPTEQLIAEWTSHLGPDQRPPSAVAKQLATQIAQLLADGMPYLDVRRGLIAWQTKGDLGPSVLPNIVHEVRTARPRRTTRQQATDTTFDQALAWAAEQDQQKAIAP